MKKLIFLCLAFMGSAMTTPFSFDEIVKQSSDTRIKDPSYVQATDDVRLAYYSFLPAQEPSAVVIFYHGGGIWSNKIYQHMAQKACDSYGIGVYLCDIRGHGNSEGKRGDTPSSEQVWEDVYTVARFVKEKHPTSKRLLGGHSSGAGLVLNYTSWNKKDDGINGYVLLAPFLGARSGTSYEHTDQSKNFVKDVSVFSLIISAITRGWLCAHSRAFAFNYPAWIYEKDPLVLSQYTCAMAHAVSPNAPNEIFAKLCKPCVVFVGRDDEQFIPEKVIASARSMTQCREKLIAEIIPDTKHLSILCEGHELLKRAVDAVGA